VKAAVLHELGGPFVIEDVELLDPKPGEVRVRLAAAGICHSDWHMVQGDLRRPFPVILGHEGAGIVEELGPGVSAVQPGDHVILNWAPDCGHCFYCSRAQPALCETFAPVRRSGTMLDGTTRFQLRGSSVCQFSTLSTFAEFCIAPQEACIPIHRDLPLDIAALVGCAVTTGIGAVTNTAQVRPGESIAVYGCGGVGLNILQGAALAGAHPIIAIDQVPAKMEIARQFGATHSLLADENSAAEVRALTGGRGADYVFEAIGLTAVQEAAFQAVRPGGALVIVGVAPIDSTARFSTFEMHVREKRILGCFYGSTDTRRDFPRILDLYQAKKIKLDELISQRYGLDQINEAYADLLKGDARRGVIVFDGA